MRKKAKRGRPPKKYPLSEQVAFAVRPEQKAAYQRAADAARLELSEWLRLVCDRAAESG